MLLKSFALRVYKNLPVKLQRKVTRVMFPTYITAAKVYLTNSEGKFLVVKTSYNPLWDIPSGHCDPKESPTDTARRELFEETSIDFDGLQQCGVIFNPQLMTTQVLFTGRLSNAVELVADGVEVVEVKWIERGDVQLNPYAQETVEVIADHKVPYWVSSLTS